MNNPATRIVTDIVRLSYAHVWEPTSINGGDPKYSCSIIIPKSDKATVEKINKAIDAAIRDGAHKFGGKVHPKGALKLPLRDGDLERDDDAYKNSWFLNANSKSAPDIVDHSVQPILDRNEVYSGCYARVSLSFYAYNTSGNKGVACGLGNIQKLRDGEPLGGHSRAADDFQTMEDDDFLSCPLSVRPGESDPALSRIFSERMIVTRTLHLDLETYSDVDLSASGVYKYAESPLFRVMLLGYSADEAPVEVVDLTRPGAVIPSEILAALRDPSVGKWAFNANFERICLSKFLGLPTGEYLSPEGWYCSMVWSAYLGLPLSLAGVGSVLGLDKQKLTEGKDLIRLFCLPGKERYDLATLISLNPEKWARFIAYNRRDVETEMEIMEKLSGFPVPDSVWSEYHLDQLINDRGIRTDPVLVRNAIAMDENSHTKLLIEMQSLTGLDNPASVAQLKSWLSSHHIDAPSLGKKEVARLLASAPEAIRPVLSLRLQLAKSSVKKYAAMAACTCSDDRARGMTMFYGANRTGRWSGRHIQLQNLPQNHLPDLDEARSLVRQNNNDALEMLYPAVPDVLSQLIRTALIPADGMTFCVADFSEIEARVLAWLSGERWRQEAFAAGKDIYCASASEMFGVPVEKHGINSHLRQKGKIAELALGYGGSTVALTTMGALEMGLREEKLKPLVDAWRAANSNIVRFWWSVDKAVIHAVEYHTPMEFRDLRFEYQSGFLFITLPSGRRLAYVKPRIGENRFGGSCITYEGVTQSKKWDRIESYGPKYVENIVQAISRDLLCNAMMNLKEERIVAHVHDELIIEVPRDRNPKAKLQEICEKMARLPAWAEGLLLRADGYVTEYYRKS